MIKNAQSEDCIGLIPAAGKGTRLDLPFPKELFPIILEDKYKPVAQYSVDYIKSAGVNHIVFVINESKHAVIGFFGAGSQFDCNFSYVVQEVWQTDPEAKSPGLAHALNSAFHLIKDKVVFFSMADTIIYPNNVLAQAKQHAPHNTDILFCLFPTKTPQKYGMVHFSKNNEIIKILDKPKITNLTHMWGCIIWTPKFSNFLHEEVSINKEGDFAVIINKSIMSGINAFGFQVEDGKYFDIGTFNEILGVQKFLTQ
jgi:glucose-1-phosphate thymidylyltransferase